MSVYGFDEHFLKAESKVHHLMKLLEDIRNSNKKEDELVSTKKEIVKDIYEDVCENNFLIAEKDNRRFSIKKRSKQNEKNLTQLFELMEFEKFTFMQQLEDNDRRIAIRKERENISQNFRILGNEAFRKQNYERALILYTKAIYHIKDSPILYNNRALTYIKLKSYKRAIIDCDYVLNKLDKKDLKSWLYRAAAYQRDGDDNNFENSIVMAQRANPKSVRYIDFFLRTFKAEGI